MRMSIINNSLEFEQCASAMHGVTEIVEETDEAYIVHTHDHADQDIEIDHNMQLAPYYQVAFQLSDTVPYKQTDLRLYIDHTMYRNGKDRLLEYDESNDIWYEQTYYKKDKRSKKWAACFTEENPGVDSITTAGVFRIVIKDTSNNIVQTSKPVYVLPNEMSFAGYQKMLRDLIAINSDFVRRESSTVGIGSPKSIEEIDLDYKIEILNRTTQLLKHIMKRSSVAQKKIYTFQPAYKARRFDAKVLNHIMKRGMEGKIPAIDYVEDHDIYENRVVRFFAERLLETIGVENTGSSIPALEKYVNTNVYKSMYRIIGRDPSALIHDIVESRNSVKPACQSGLSTYIFSFSKNAYHSFYKNCISVEEQQISTYGSGKNSNNPFQQPQMPYCGIGFYTTNNRMKLWILKQLVNLYNPNLDTKSVRIQAGSYYPITEGKPELAIWWCFKELGEIQFEVGGNVFSSVEIEQEIKDLTLQEYFAEIAKLRKEAKRYDLLIDVRDKRFDLTQAYLSIKKDYEKQYDVLMANNQLAEASSNLRSIVSSEWMTSITDIHSLHSVRSTQLFVRNDQYRKIYKLIHKVTTEFPFLCDRFDINAYGVEKTEQIYEYWTFLKLIKVLKELGFYVVEGRNDKTPDRYFSEFFFPKRQFPVFKGKVSEHAGFHFKMQRDIHDKEGGLLCIRIEVGFDCYMDSRGKQPSISPDIYIKVFHPNNAVHWYFFDAKYRPLDRKSAGDDSVSPMVLEDVIGEVSIGKYGASDWPGGNAAAEEIIKLQEPAMENEIRGSYLIIPCMKNETKDYLNDSDKDRLFGGDQYIDLTTEIIEKGKKKKRCVIKSAKNDEMEKRARHHYGAIILSPDDQDAAHSELKILIKMIFEYMEIEPGEIEIQNTNGRRWREYSRANLKACWNCGYESTIEPEINLTAGGYDKFSYTCPNCGMLRIDNHCLSPQCIHWPIIKYAYGNYHRQNKPWLYYCPQCGNDGSVKSDSIDTDANP